MLSEKLYVLTPGFAKPWIDTVSASPLGRRVAQGIFWSLAGAAIARILSMLASIVLARLLKDENFGAFGVIQSTAGMFGVFGGLGIGLAATKYVAEFRVSNPDKAGRSIAFAYITSAMAGIFASGSLFLFAGVIARDVLAAPDLAPQLRVSSLLVFLGALNGVNIGALTGLESFRTIAVTNLLSGLISGPLLVLGAWLNGLPGAVWALSITAGITFLFNYLYLRADMNRNGIEVPLGNWSREWRNMIGFSMPILLSSFLSAITGWAGNAMLVNQKTGYHQMALVNAANTWHGIVVFIAANSAQAMFPAFAEKFGLQDNKSVFKILKTSLLASLLIATPLTLTGIFGSRLIMGLYGEQFETGGLILSVILTTAWLYTIHVVLNQVLLASGKTWLWLWLHVVWAGVFLAVNSQLVHLGGIGLAISNLIALAVLITLSGICVWRLFAEDRAVSV